MWSYYPFNISTWLCSRLLVEGGWSHPLGVSSRNRARVTLVLYRKRTARRFRLASTSGVRFRYSRQKEAARRCGGRGVLWEFNRFLPERPCQTRTLTKTLLLMLIDV